MGIIKETDQRFVGIEKKIGIFVFIAIIGILTAFAFMGIHKDIFIPKTKIYFIAESGRGINEGMAVKLSGFKIGKVERLSLDDIARVKVDMSIDTRYMKWIKTDSRARLTKEGVIGDSIIEVTPGSVHAEQVSENSMIAFEREKGLSEMTEELKDEIKPVLTDIKEIIHYVNDPEGDIKQAFKNLKQLSGDISITKQHLDSILRNADKNMPEAFTKLHTLLDSANQTLTTADCMVKRIDKDIPHIMEKVDKSLTNFQRTTEELTSILEKGSEVAEGSKEVVDSVKKVWPIRSFIKAPEEKRLKVDSYE